MSNLNELPLSAVGLTGLPSLDDLLLLIDSQTWKTLKPVMARMPLLNLLNEILNLSFRSEEKEKRALLDMARLAISKHQYTRRLYSEIVDAVMTGALEETDPPLPNLPQQDARLAMEMLSVIAELLAINKVHERGVKTFRIAELIADRFGLIGDKAIVFHQLGTYELQRGEFAKAEAALRKAAQIFAPLAPDLERRSNYQRALVYQLRLEFEADPPEPDDMEAIMARDPAARDLVLLARARKAVDRDELATADTLIEQLGKSHPEDEFVSSERLITEARLARRKGEFEKAELLLKQASKTAGEVRSLEIAWESFYLARDLGHHEESQALLERLRGESDAVRVDYQKAIVALNTGDYETAEKLLRNCLLRTEKDMARADCMGMLALVSEDGSEARRFFHEAIGLYVKLDRKLDHAISLSHLAAMEFDEALGKKGAGWPKAALSQFRRADNLLQHSQEIAESLGAFSFLLDLMMTKAKLEMKRERYNVALRYFNKAATSLELTYLAMTDRRSANLYLSNYSAFYTLAISCALSAGNTGDALLFSERGKARRFLRDAAETSYEGSTDSAHSLLIEERQLLAKIQPLRGRLIQQRSLSLQERQALYDSERELSDLWRRMRQTPEVSSELSKRVHQPLEVGVLRQIVFSEAPVIDREEHVSGTDEDVEELPGGGVMQCDRCFVYNRIASTFCSACRTLLPKSASVNMDLWLGTATEEEVKQAFADNQYNQGAELFHSGKIAEAEPFFQEAMKHASHPDYSFFYGLCRLADNDSTAALQSFDDVHSQQYRFKYPSWPLPLSPDDFRRCVEHLRRNQKATTETLFCLMHAYGDYSEKRRESRPGQIAGK